MPNFMNKVYNRGFAQEVKVEMLKEIIALVLSYVFDTRKERVERSSGKI